MGNGKRGHVEPNLSIREQWPDPYDDDAPLEAFDGWRANPSERYACPSCAPLLGHARAVLENDGLSLLKADHPARCDTCDGFGDAYVYYLSQPNVMPCAECYREPCECADRTNPENVAPTWPAPPPESSIPPVVTRDDERWIAATDVPRGSPAPTFAHDARKLRGVGHWLDHGKDTGPRLRVRGFVDMNDVQPLVEPEPTHDPKLIDEIHAESEAAFRDEDDGKLAKIYEDVLDDIHGSSAGQATLEGQLLRAVEELQAAVTAELREVARAEKNWGWKHSLSEYGIRVRARTPQGEIFECQVGQRGTRELVVKAVTDPRGAAVELVKNAREYIHNARARTLVGGYVPVQNEVGQA